MWFIIVVYSIICYSISNMFVNAYGPFGMFQKIHDAAERVHPNLGELFSCMICFPTWVGFTLSLLNYIFLPYVCLTPCSIILGSIAPWYVIVFFDGMFASGITWLIHSWQESTEVKNTQEDSKEVDNG